MCYTPDKSGIKSLAGFSFQIKVFCAFASRLQEGQRIEFESIDDVAANKNCKPDNLDIVNGRITTQEYDSIQVKHTKLDDSNATNILLNWVQLEDSSYTVSKYILVTDAQYIGKIIFNLLQELGEENIQIFMFDSEKAENLGIDDKYSKNLVNHEKSGLCPFFQKPKTNTQESN